MPYALESAKGEWTVNIEAGPAVLPWVLLMGRGCCHVYCLQGPGTISFHPMSCSLSGIRYRVRFEEGDLENAFVQGDKDFFFFFITLGMYRVCLLV